MLVHLDHLAGVLYRQGQAGRVVLRQLSLNGRSLPDQDDLETQVTGHLDRPIDHHGWGMVAAHGIHYDLHLPSPT